MVGKSTCGRGATGKNGKATSPTNAIAAINDEVATGRSMKGSEIFMTIGPRWRIDPLVSLPELTERTKFKR